MKLFTLLVLTVCAVLELLIGLGVGRTAALVAAVCAGLAIERWGATEGEGEGEEGADWPN